MATPTKKRKYEEVHWSLYRSSLAVGCVGVSAFRFPIVGVLSFVAIMITNCTVHMSVEPWIIYYLHGLKCLRNLYVTKNQSLLSEYTDLTLRTVV